MQATKELEQKVAFKPNTLFYSFAIIVVLLMLISLINVTIRGLFSSDQYDGKNKIANLIFDPDKTLNWTSICPILQDTTSLSHALKWKLTNCYNKTLLHWHIPWIKIWIWRRFDDITEERKRLKEEEVERAKRAEEEKDKKIDVDGSNAVEDDTTGKDLNKSATNTEPKKESSSVAYTALSILVLMSAIVACIEFLHEKFGKKSIEEANAQEQRRCSLADFTMNKHLRKESHETLQRQAAFDEPRKVNSFMHQGSLDRAITRLSAKVSSRLLRQSSVPVTMGSTSSSSDQVSNLQAFRIPSMDTSEEERSPNMRRKSRHFIRRH